VIAVLATEVRRSPLRWWAPILLAGILVVTLGSGSWWAGIWPAASAQAEQVVLFLGPLMMAGAAYAATRSSDPTARAWIDSSTRTVWRGDSIQLASTVCIALALYLAGVITVIAASEGQSSSGHFWLGYGLLGALTLTAITAAGHLIGRVISSPVVAPTAAGVIGLIIMMAIASRFGLLVTANLAYSWYGISGMALLVRAFLATSLMVAAVAVPTRMNRGDRWPRPSGQRAFSVGAAVGVVAAAALLPATPVLAQRQPPSQPLCTATNSRICLWPDERKYLPDFSQMGRRLAALRDSTLDIPSTFYERGLNRVADRAGKSFYSPVGAGGFYLTAFEMAAIITDDSLTGRLCLPRDPAEQAKVFNASEFLLDWLSAQIAGGGQPPSVHGTNSIADSGQIGRMLFWPVQRRRAFTQRLISIVKSSSCPQQR
jgi:hypothetical protein